MYRPVIDLTQSKVFLTVVGLLIRAGQVVKKIAVWLKNHIMALIVVALFLSTMAIAELTCNGSIADSIGVVLMIINGAAAVGISSILAKGGENNG